MGLDRHLLELWDRFINVQVCLETIINMNNKNMFSCNYFSPVHTGHWEIASSIHPV